MTQARLNLLSFRRHKAPISVAIFLFAGVTLGTFLAAFIGRPSAFIEKQRREAYMVNQRPSQIEPFSSVFRLMCFRLTHLSTDLSRPSRGCYADNRAAIMAKEAFYDRTRV